jgi:hypothetical protein
VIRLITILALTVGGFLVDSVVIEGGGVGGTEGGGVGGVLVADGVEAEADNDLFVLAIILLGEGLLDLSTIYYLSC